MAHLQLVDMCNLVISQTVLPSKTLSAQVAFKWFLSGMNSHVSAALTTESLTGSKDLIMAHV